MILVYIRRFKAVLRLNREVASYVVDETRGDYVITRFPPTPEECYCRSCTRYRKSSFISPK